MTMVTVGGGCDESISLEHVRNRIPVGINCLVSPPVLLAFQTFDVIFEVFPIFSCVEAPVNRCVTMKILGLALYVSVILSVLFLSIVATVGRRLRKTCSLKSNVF